MAIAPFADRRSPPCEPIPVPRVAVPRIGMSYEQDYKITRLSSRTRGPPPGTKHPVLPSLGTQGPESLHPCRPPAVTPPAHPGSRVAARVAKGFKENIVSAPGTMSPGRRAHRGPSRL